MFRAESSIRLTWNHCSLDHALIEDLQLSSLLFDALFAFVGFFQLTLLVQLQVFMLLCFMDVESCLSVLIL